MGLDATIRRRDGRPLGRLEQVQAALAAVFTGAQFGREPAGSEKIRVMSARGIEFPEVIRRALESTPETVVGVFEGAVFSIEFRLGAGDAVVHVDATLRGNTAAARPFLDRLEAETGWTCTFP